MKHRKKTRNDFSPWTGEVVKLVWNDPLHICQNITEKELAKQPDISFTSYGLVIADDGKRLTIAATLANQRRDKELREVTRIPWSLVSEIKYMEVINV